MAEPPPAARTPVAGGHDTPPAAWVTLGQNNVADCAVFRVKRRRMRHITDGREGQFYVIEAPDWVQTLALTPRRELILVRQWRFGIEKLSWEPPGGVIESGEDILAAAQRELLEETGQAGTSPRLIGQAYPNPAIQNNQTHFVLVENCTPKAPTHWDPHEELQIGIFSLDEIHQMIRRGEIFHSLALNALQFLFIHLADLPAPDLFAP
jgi:8-oxo-dGTP pyrophosphatase MutT (NUDIX family)